MATLKTKTVAFPGNMAKLVDADSTRQYLNVVVKKPDGTKVVWYGPSTDANLRGPGLTLPLEDDLSQIELWACVVDPSTGNIVANSLQVTVVEIVN